MKSYSLLPLVFQPLPLGSVKPQGWLRQQLRIQADGLSGHLADLWFDIARSAWIGGDADGWERGPYWLDGFVPLAFLLDDDTLKATARRWIDTILRRQRDDGWLGPVSGDPKLARPRLDPWPVFVALKAMTQWQEATGDDRIIPAMRRFFGRLDTLLDEQPLFDWGRYRWSDLALSLYWLYERTGDEALLRLAAKSHAQSFDWQGHFAAFPYQAKRTRDQIVPQEPQEQMTFRLDMASHVVNNAMAIKQPAVWYRLSHDAADRAAAQQFIATLDRYHGQASGVFTGDEHLAGTSPSQGTELCAVVEYLFSLETLVAIAGDGSLADRLERIAFNALPAPFSPDMWTHQYVQQANQVQCAIVEDRVYTNNGPDANIFGLEPHFGCCTANFHQGWPKFAASQWMRAADGGLAAIGYAPCVVHATLGDQPVTLTVETAYPWNDRVRMTVETDAPVVGRLHLRIPGWANGATLDGMPLGVTGGSFHVVERRWEGRTTLDLWLSMRVETTQRSGGVAVERGPLLYSLPIEERWQPVAPRNRSGAVDDPRIAHDYEVHPVSPWNYALVVDPARPDSFFGFEEHPVGSHPFSPAGAPTRLHARGVRVPWQIEHGAAAPPPALPTATAAPEPITLVPYGCTTLRITEFPVVSPSSIKEPT